MQRLRTYEMKQVLFVMLKQKRFELLETEEVRFAHRAGTVRSQRRNPHDGRTRTEDQFLDHFLLQHPQSFQAMADQGSSGHIACACSNAAIAAS